MNDKVAIVTGGAGFIGSHVVDQLLAIGLEVRVIDNFSGGHKNNLSHHNRDSNLSVFETDVLDLPTASKIFDGVNYVFHFAGRGDIVPSIERPYEYMTTNVLGTTRVLECARYAQVEKFIYAASSSCYGIASTPTNESHKISPQYPYALSKYQGEQACFHWQNVYGLPVNSIRIFNAYGPRVRTTGVYGAVFGVFFKQKLAQKPLTIVGDVEQTRDFVFVTDVANAFVLAALSKNKGQIYNLGSGSPQKINMLAKLIGGELVFLPSRPGEPFCTWADITKIKKELGWVPSVSFTQGVKEMLQHIDLWEDAPLWDEKSIAEATTTWFKYLG